MKKQFIFIILFLIGDFSCTSVVEPIIKLASIQQQYSPRVSAPTPSIDKMVGSAYNLGTDKNDGMGYGNYAKYFQADIIGSPIIISGLNFGVYDANKSSISVQKYEAGAWVNTTSYSFVINSSGWKDNTISGKLTSQLTSGVVDKARIVVKNANGNSNFFLCSIVPYVQGRQYIECTWHVIKMSLETESTKKAAKEWTSAYDDSNPLTLNDANAKKIDANYVPTDYDVLIWDKKHEAFIEKVTSWPDPNDKTVTVYGLRISESNVPLGTGVTYYPKDDKLTLLVKVKKDPKTNVKSFVTGADKYRSGRSDGANLVRIQ